MSAGAFTRTMHRMHRAFGGTLSVLLIAWFLSGAVMTFSDFPRFSQRERLETAPLLPAEAEIEVPPAVLRAVRGNANGARARLAMHEDVPTWLFEDASEGRVALRAVLPCAVQPLDAARAGAEAERRLRHPVAQLERLTQSDQWTVALQAPGTFPVYRVRFADARGREVYLCARTGELIQESLRSERALAWIGAIPHWIYPTILRRDRTLWRYVVLVLSGLGLVVTLSGTLAGLHVWRTIRKRKPLRDPYLRSHQTLGLGFGLLATLWLFSGALSLSPFQWAGDERTLDPREQAALHPSGLLPETVPVQAALRRCQEALGVRELELTVLGDAVYAVCSDAARQTRIVDLTDPALTARHALAPERLHALARRLSGGEPHVLTLAHAYDDYHYPTHGNPEAALPYARIDLSDAQHTSYYLDPARATLIRRHTDSSRLERWLYHGLHSVDFPRLYQHQALWRTLVLAAMSVGAALSGLGLAMQVRRWLRRARAARRVH